MYQLKNDAGHVAKIYHAGKLPPEDKLRLMLQSPPDEPTRSMQHVSIVWLTDLIQDHKGQILGILMPKIPWGIPIHQLYHPRSRREKFVGFDWRYLHRSAANLAAAVAAIHAKGYVIGDLNESNILVQPTALVSMIDTDSFQVPNPNGETFRCRVGKPEFTAPELQSVRLSTIDRGEEHDRFALAVMIFLLLMEGSHPFRGIGGPHELGDRIQQGLYPYSLTGSSAVKAPPLNPPFRNLHPEIRQLFQTCFVDGFSHPYRRPRAAVWADTLSYIEGDFTQCSRNRHHIFLQANPKCPWCERTQLLRGRDPFPEKAPAAQKTIVKTPQGNTKRKSPQKTQSQKARKPKRSKGKSKFFTPGNILGLLTVIGIASALLVPAILTAVNRSKFNNSKIDMREIVVALESYMADTNYFPTVEKEIDFHTELLPKEYYDDTVTDAWGRPFRYVSNGESYRLISYGKDKKPGRRSKSEFDADIIFENGAFLEEAGDVTQLAPLIASAPPSPTPKPAPSPTPTAMPAATPEPRSTPAEGFWDVANRAYWTTYLQENPEDTEARLKLAYAYEEAGRFDDVIRECLELLKYDEHSSEAKTLLAWTYARQEKELDMALELAMEVLEEHTSTWALYVLGGVHYARDEYEHSIQTLKRALEKPDEHFASVSSAYHLLAWSYEQLEQYELALEAIDNALDIAPDDELLLETRQRITSLYAPKASAETPGWEYTYKSDKPAEALVVRTAEDGGYFVAGQVEKSGILLKLDAQGTLAWQKGFGLKGEAFSQIRDMQLTESGGLVIAGQKQVADENRRDRLLCFLSQDRIWDCKSYQSSEYDIHEVHALGLLPDGGFALAGCVQEKESGNWRIMTQQFDRDRGFVTGKFYSPSDGGFSCAHALQVRPDEHGSLELIAGGTWKGSGIVYTLNAQQEIVWDERFKSESVETLRLLPDGGVLLAGIGGESWFTRLDADGNEVWGKFFNDPQHIPAALFHSKNGDYVLAGYTLPSGEQKAGVWVMRIDLDGGKPEYLHDIPVNNSTEIASIAQAEDGHYVLAGHYLKEGLKTLWVIKFGED